MSDLSADTKALLAALRDDMSPTPREASELLRRVEAAAASATAARPWPMRWIVAGLGTLAIAAVMKVSNGPDQSSGMRKVLRAPTAELSATEGALPELVVAPRHARTPTLRDEVDARRSRPDSVRERQRSVEVVPTTTEARAATPTSMSNETLLLQEANVAYRRHELDVAEEKLQQLATEFPAGALLLERETLLALVDCARGRPTHAIAFVQRHPDSAYAQRIARDCGLETGRDEK